MSIENAEIIQRGFWVFMVFATAFAMRGWYGKDKRAPTPYAACALGSIGSVAFLGTIGIVKVTNAVDVIVIVIFLLSTWGMAMPDQKKESSRVS